MWENPMLSFYNPDIVVEYIFWMALLDAQLNVPT